MYPALLPLMRTSRLASSRLNRRPLTDLNGFVRFAERRNLISARVLSHLKRNLPCFHGFLTRRTSGHYLQTFRAINIFAPPIINVAPITTPTVYSNSPPPPPLSCSLLSVTRPLTVHQLGDLIAIFVTATVWLFQAVLVMVRCAWHQNFSRRQRPGNSSTNFGQPFRNTLRIALEMWISKLKHIILL